jgi:hypothetical protein
MNAVVAKFGLVDSVSYHHGTDGKVATHSRSNNRLDYVLCTHAVAPSIWRCGVLPFNFVTCSDHRGVFIDVDIDEFLGGDPPALMSIALRGICSQSPKAFIQCVEETEQCMSEHNVCERIASLEALTILHGLTDHLQKKWEGVDQDILRACLHAEKSVTKKHRPPWSFALHQASLLATYWRTALSGERTNRDVDLILESLAQSIEGDSPQPTTHMSVSAIQVQLRLVQAELKKIRQEASSLRSVMLQERAAAEALDGNDAEATILRRLERAEATKACFGLLRKYLKPTSSGGLTKVQVTDGTDANGAELFRDVTESEEKFALILERNFKHFGQANGTTFTEAPLKDWLGTHGETDTGQATIHGELQPVPGHGFPKTQTVLDLLQPFDPPAAPISALLVTSGDFKSFFAKWKEGTSASPSGKHLGHYKALLSPAIADDYRLTASANRIIEAHLSWPPDGAMETRNRLRYDRKESGELSAQQASDDSPVRSGLQLAPWHDLQPPHGAWSREARPSPRRTMGLQTGPIRPRCPSS